MLSQAQGWTMEAIKSTPDKRFFKSHANLKQLPVGSAKGLKVTHLTLVFAIDAGPASARGNTI